MGPHRVPGKTGMVEHHFKKEWENWEGGCILLMIMGGVEHHAQKM